jgi:ssDNA-binding Zn-finger/Zn-ribbon topoisomerase 1
MSTKTGRERVAEAINSRLKKAWSELPEHPSVDWATLEMREGRMRVAVTCPVCKEARWLNAAEVKRTVRDRPFDGRCYKDRLLFKRKATGKPLPNHPQVDWNDQSVVSDGRQRVTGVAVTCPTCGDVRYDSRNNVKHRILDGRFSGKCGVCSGRAKWKKFTRIGPGRTIDTAKGYIRLSRDGISLHDRPIYDAMRTSAGFVFEHRFVMAKQLGRPLKGNELVDHMDGVKTNNAPKNLRLYVRGKNQPGETTGYGTYYHEWQLALARVRKLEEQIGIGQQHRLFSN